jgi:hypothetical protein
MRLFRYRVVQVGQRLGVIERLDGQAATWRGRLGPAQQGGRTGEVRTPSATIAQATHPLHVIKAQAAFALKKAKVTAVL